MLDHPTAPDMLEAVARLLRDTLIPQLPPAVVFQARVAANAVDLVAREMRLGAQAQDQAHGRLQTLLGQEGSLATLESALCTGLRLGEIAADAPGLQEHLWATTLAKLAIDQPTYAPYRHALEQRATDSVTDLPATTTTTHPKE